MPDEAPIAATVPKGADPRLLPETGRHFRLTAALLAGGLAAAIFGSRLLLQEIDGQPDMPGYATLRPAAALWHQAMQRIGAAAPDHALHHGIRAAEARHFPSDP